MCYSIISFFSTVPSSYKYILGKFNSSFINLPFRSNVDNIFLEEVIPNWTKTYYTFRHTTPINEPMINAEKLIELLNLHGWKFSKEFEIENTLKNSWSQLNDNIKRYGFIRMK